MSFAKNLWTDLVEKRLWPVALVLLAALVAIPVLLGGGAAAPAPLGATGPTGSEAQLAQVALEGEAPQRRDRLGRLRDPFEQGKAPAAPAAPADASGPATAPAADLAPAGVGGGGGLADPGGPTAPADPATTPAPGPREPAAAEGEAPAPDPADAYRAVVRFGETGSKRPTRSIERLTPLPSPENPAFVYLGVEDGKAGDKVVLLLSSEVKATGDGACRPNKTSCESIELEPGDTEFLDVTGEDGKVRQYQLDLQRIDKTGARPVRRGVAARAGS